MPTLTRIKKISPLQLGKMLAVLYGLISLIIVPFFLLFSVIGAVAGVSQHGSAGPAALGAGFGIVMAIALPIFYAAFGFIGGVIGGYLYNLVARWIGGIEIEIEQVG